MNKVRVKTTILITFLMCLTGIMHLPYVYAPNNAGERLTDFRTNYNQRDPRIASARTEEDTDPVKNPLFYAPFIAIITLVAALVLSTNRKRKN